MLDSFLDIVYRDETAHDESVKLAHMMTDLPDEELAKIASGEVKIGFLECGDGKWLDKYKGSPLMEQAIALEQESLQMEMQRKETNQQRQDMYREEDRMRDEISIKKRMLDLELAKAESGIGDMEQEMPAEEEEMPPDAPPPPGPPEPVEEEEPPAEEAPPMAEEKAAAAKEMFGKAVSKLRGAASTVANKAKSTGKAVKETWTGERLQAAGKELSKAQRAAKRVAKTTSGKEKQVQRLADAGKGVKSETWKQRGLKGGTAVAGAGALGFGAHKALGKKKESSADLQLAAERMKLAAQEAQFQQQFKEALIKVAQRNYALADEWGRELAVTDFQKVAREKDAAGWIQGLKAVARGTRIAAGKGGTTAGWDAFKGLGKQYIKKNPVAAVGLAAGGGALAHKAMSDQ